MVSKHWGFNEKTDPVVYFFFSLGICSIRSVHVGGYFWGWSSACDRLDWVSSVDHHFRTSNELYNELRDGLSFRMPARGGF